jgi:hypothetical protein
MTFTPTNAFEWIAASCVCRLMMHGRMGMRRRRIVVPRLLGTSRLITKGDEERGYVFAVLTALGERGACASAFDAIRGQIDAHRMRFRIARADDAAGAHFANFDVLDDATSKVFEPPQESARAKKAAQATVAQGGKGVGDRRRHGEYGCFGLSRTRKSRMATSTRPMWVSQEERQEHNGDDGKQFHENVNGWPSGVFQWIADRVTNDGSDVRWVVDARAGLVD